MSPCAAAGLRFVVVASVGVDNQVHVRGLVREAGLRVGGTIVQEVLDSGQGGLGWIGLFGGEGTEGDV